MKFLLDTHALYWWVFFPEILPEKVRELIADPGNTIFASAVSAYEMSYKHHRGKWHEVAPLVMAFEEVMSAENFEVLPLTAVQAALAGTFTVEHRDPFDRMLVAQAIIERLEIISNDREMALLGVEPLWD